VNDLIAQLIALTGRLEAAAGVALESLAALRRSLAAALVQQDPALAAFVAPPDVDAAMVDAARAGVDLAAEKTAAGVRLRFVREAWLAVPADAARPAQLFGPFIDGDASLVQFTVFETAPMLSVVLDVHILFVDVHDLPMLLPRETVGDADLRNFSIPAGTVWVNAARLVAGATGYVVLRVAGGSLELSVPAVQAGPGADVQLAIDSAWRLTLVPEPAPPPVAGSDGDALAIELPSELVIQSDGTVTVTGAIGVSGFGSALRFDTPRGGPVLTDRNIVFPYEGLADAWTIAANRSRLAALGGEGTVALGLWALPVTQIAPDQAFEALHGGSIAVQLHGELRTHWAGAQGGFVSTDVNLTADAMGLEMQTRHPDAAVQLALSLWGPARSDLAFEAGTADLRYASRRGGADIVSVAGGRLRNRWDLPRDANGEPFACDATIITLSLVAERDGLNRIACAARQRAEPQVQGLALENMFLQVLPVRELALAGSGAAAGEFTQGRARLLFDVQLAEPMLPDPYAASWNLPDELRIAESALSIALRWQADAPVAVQAQIEKAIQFPEPRDIADESDVALGRRFIEQLNAQPEFLSLLDLSTHDHHFGVAL